MPTPETATLPQHAVWWPCTGYSDSGDPIHGAAVAVKVKWEQDTRLLLNSQGSPNGATTTVFVDRVMGQDDQLWLGRLDILPENPTDLMLLVAFNEIGDIKGRRTTRMATLMRKK